MRIYVKADDMKLPIVLLVPTSALGWSGIWRIVNKNARSAEKGLKKPNADASDGTGTLPDPVATAEKGAATSFLTEETAKALAKAIKKYVRKNGHFDLVNIKAADGSRIRIRV